jgi:tetratricopeptide (TPR) repeat protein
MFRALAFSITLILVCAGVTAQTFSSFPTQHSPGEQGSIVGRVLIGQSQSAADLRVSVLEMLSGAVVASTYTNASGGFEFDNIPYGTYEITATAGVDESREQVRLVSPRAEVSLRMTAPAEGADAGNADSVSVNDLKVPKKAREAYHKAEAALRGLKLDEALSHAGKALEAYPRYAAAMALRGIIKLDQNATDQAVTDLEQAIQFDPAFATGYLALGAAYNRLSRFDDSIRTVDRGIALAPMAWQGYFELGKAYVGKGDFPAAIKQLNKAEDMAPKNFALVHLVKAHAMLGLKDYAAAMLELQSYLTQRPQGPDSDQARKTLDEVRTFVARTDR